MATGITIYSGPYSYTLEIQDDAKGGKVLNLASKELIRNPDPEVEARLGQLVHLIKDRLVEAANRRQKREFRQEWESEYESQLEDLDLDPPTVPPESDPDP